MSVRVVVADRSAARFYDTHRLGGPLRLFDDLRHPQGRLHERTQHETQLFACRIAEILWAAHELQQFERLVLVAEPSFLGVLRAELPETLSAITVAAIGKDFMHEKPTQLEKILQQSLATPALA